MTKIVRKHLSSSTPSAAAKRRLARLARRPDSSIDFSDIQPLTENFWRNAVRNPFYRPLKQQLTLRLDADIVAWLRSQGKGYQTRANSLLREAMLRALRRKAS
jgi:uncharacterized protein (DUF4415 family)